MNEPVIVAHKDGRLLARVIVTGPPKGSAAVRGVVEHALRQAGFMDAEVHQLGVVTASGEVRRREAQ